MIEPAGPVFAGHARLIGPKCLELRKRVFRLAGTEIDHRQHAGQCVVAQQVRAIGGEQQIGAEAGAIQRLMDLLHVRAIVAVGAVFVLDLHGDDRPAMRGHQRRQFLAQPLEVAFHRLQIFRILRAHVQMRIGEQPSGEAARFPFGAYIRARAKDHVQPLFLRHAYEGGHVVVAAEIELAWLGFDRVPVNVGGDGIEAHRTCFPQAVLPVRARDALEVHRAGNDLVNPAGPNEMIALDGDGCACGGAPDPSQHTEHACGDGASDCS